MLICLSNLRFDCKVTPRYLVESVFFQDRYHEVYIKLHRILFLSDKDVTFYLGGST